MLSSSDIGINVYVKDLSESCIKMSHSRHFKIKTQIFCYLPLYKFSEGISILFTLTTTKIKRYYLYELTFQVVCRESLVHKSSNMEEK